MAEVLNAAAGVPIVTADQASTLTFYEGEIVYVRGLAQYRGGDGVTVGGIQFGSGGGSGGSAIGFRVIAVTDVDPSLWIQAEIVDDTLTVEGFRGIALSTSPASDKLIIGLPDGGAYGNLLLWTGSAWVPNPPPAPNWTPQEGDYDTDLVAESPTRKYWDGCIELAPFAAPTDPAGTTTHNGRTFFSFADAATGLLRAYGKIPSVNYTHVYLDLRLNAVPTSGAVGLVTRIDRLVDVAAAVSFGSDATAAPTVPSDGADFLVSIEITSLDNLNQGNEFLVEFGRQGAIAGDTCAGAVTLVSSRLRLE